MGSYAQPVLPLVNRGETYLVQREGLERSKTAAQLNWYHYETTRVLPIYRGKGVRATMICSGTFSLLTFLDHLGVCHSQSKTRSEDGEKERWYSLVGLEACPFIPLDASRHSTQR